MKIAHLQRRSLMRELVAQGVRITTQRRVLIETIQRAEGHIDAPTLLAMARTRDASIDRATVYRTIDLLKKRGLIDELDLMHLTGEKHFYEVKTHRDHVHLACFECGKIEEFTSPVFERLKGEIARQSGFQIKVVRLEVGGRAKRARKPRLGKAAPATDRRQQN
jgi:Fe2+ or Zn2+ uptake regulation protein